MAIYRKFLAAAALTMLSAAGSGAQVATFEGQGGTGSSLPTGYTVPGLNWNNILLVEATTYGGSNTTGCLVSGSYCVAPGSGAQSSLTNSTPFDFSSGYFMAWFSNGNFGNPVTLDVQGYLGATLIGSQTLVLNTTTAQHYQFDYAGVDRVEFITNGNSGAAWYLADDIEFNNNSVTAAPEPASMMLMGTGLLGIAGIARRRTRASKR